MRRDYKDTENTRNCCIEVVRDNFLDNYWINVKYEFWNGTKWKRIFEHDFRETKDEIVALAIKFRDELSWVPIDDDTTQYNTDE